MVGEKGEDPVVAVVVALWVETTVATTLEIARRWWFWLSGSIERETWFFFGKRERHGSITIIPL